MADSPREPLDDILRRLKQERDDADARYNAALTALDRALPAPIALPPPAAGIDDHQRAVLNEAWNTLPAPPPETGYKGKLIGFVWRIVAPYLQRQLTFNSHLVDHINRTTAAQQHAHRVSEEAAAALGEQLARLAGFQSRLMVYLQQITAYVDTKDRDASGGALVLNAALSGLAEHAAKQSESLTAREQRYEARTSAIAAAQDELRAMIGVMQQGLLTLKRELERGVQGVQEVQGVQGVQGVQAFAGVLDAYKYVGFEDRFRGSPEVIRARLETYLPRFEGRGPVLDVGCGRGEFLQLLASHGIEARGIDLNHEMAESCRAAGLNVVEADAVSYLAGLADGSLGGIFSAQVVEHLQPPYLLRFLELAFHKLRPGGRFVLETLNPACWVAFFDSYIRDITHVWPLHPETLKFLVLASGFSTAAIEFSSPVAPHDRLQPIALPSGADTTLADLAEAFNGNVDKLNARIFTYRDYAIVGEK